LNLGAHWRLANRDQADIRFLEGKVSVECLSPDCAPTQGNMKRVLGRIPDDSGIHLVVTHSLWNHYFLSRTRDKFGNKRYDNFREDLPDSLQQAHFYRVGSLAKHCNEEEEDDNGKNGAAI
ncbi:hypothetical protein JG688_00009087, partial [Phytophthora aleatoria]